jgi:hypothetical protein
MSADQPNQNSPTVRPGIYQATADLCEMASAADMLILPMPPPWPTYTVCVRFKTETERSIFERLANP